MNKNIVIIMVVIFLIGGGVFLANNRDNDNKSPKNEPAAMERIDTSESSGSSAQPAARSTSNYVEYSKESLAQNSNKKRVLFFYASWCPICIPADKDFRENTGKFPEDVVVIRVNYNDPDTDQEEKDLAKKYAVTYQHTFVQIDSTDAEVTKWNGGGTEELLENIKQ